MQGDLVDDQDADNSPVTTTLGESVEADLGGRHSPVATTSGGTTPRKSVETDLGGRHSAVAYMVSHVVQITALRRTYQHNSYSYILTSFFLIEMRFLPRFFEVNSKRSVSFNAIDKNLLLLYCDAEMSVYLRLIFQLLFYFFQVDLSYPLYPEIGEFVAVYYDKNFFIGAVVEKIHEHYKIKFLKQRG